MMSASQIAGLLPDTRGSTRQWGAGYVRTRDLPKLGIPHHEGPALLIVMELARHIAGMDWARDARRWWYCALRHVALREALAGEKALIEAAERRTEVVRPVSEVLVANDF